MRTEIIEILQKAYPEHCLKHIDTANEIMRLYGDNSELFLELAVRTNRTLPEREKELAWFDEGTDIAKCGDFQERFFNEIERIRNACDGIKGVDIQTLKTTNKKGLSG